MASITSLPVEIFYQLSEINNFRSNLLNLRLTCKVLDAKLRNIHLNLVHRTLNIFFTPIYLQNLLEFSKTPQSPHLRARNLVICTRVPNTVTVRGLREIEGRWAPVQKPEQRLDENDKEVFVEMECLAYDHTRTIHEIRDGRHKPPVALFASILSVLRNVESIDFQEEYDGSLSLFEFSLLFPSLGLNSWNRPSSRLRRYAVDWMCSKDQFSMIWWCVMHALQMANSSKIHSVTANELMKSREPVPTSGISFLGFQTQPEGFSILNLRQLDIFADGKTYNNSCREGFSAWLQAIGGQLEFLHLSLDRAQGFTFPTTRGLPNLKALKITSGWLDISSFQTFLRHAKDKLQSLMIYKSKFTTETQTGDASFQMLKFAREILLNLRVFMFNIESLSPFFQTHMVVEGWERTAVCSGNIEYSERPFISIQFFMQNLAGQLDAHSNAQQLWESLGALTVPDYSGALRLNHDDYGDEDNSEAEYDSEDHASDSDYPSDWLWAGESEGEDDELEYDSQYESD